ncbi:hypothetical protein RND71_001078 [Anisodus tanguticus]|uniref:Uncharacterized protein n=1 Tax=Anisodus tanguticus TaxID=243964 RepID=A0AAE1T0K1_9SOLA|nr:hypothetical protein RND71_001078 [Anisodus tanguticus]
MAGIFTNLDVNYYVKNKLVALKLNEFHFLQNSGLPWIVPKKTLSLDLSNLSDALDGVLGEGSDAVTVGLGAAAAAGLGLFAFTEVETILQLLGSAALVQLVGKKLLFAEDRKQTLQQLDEFLTTKVAPKELVDEIKQIGKALLPDMVSSNALPAPAEASPASATSTVEKTELVAMEEIAPPKVEATSPPTPEVNSVPKAEESRQMHYLKVRGHFHLILM